MAKKNKINYDIVFEDDDLIIVNKSSGMLSIPDRYNTQLPNLKNILDEKYGQIFIVHRLDKETSGIIVFAKTAETHRELSMMFEEHKVKKIYHTIVTGVMHKEEILVDIPLMVNPGRKGGMIPSARGKEAYTKVRVLEKFRNTSLLECELLTGRQHQIRAHLKAVGYPLLIDKLYSNTEEFMLSSIKKHYNKNKNVDEKPIMERTSLHSYYIEFIHPITKKEISAKAEYPKDFKVTLSLLGKYSKMPDYYVGSM